MKTEFNLLPASYCEPVEPGWKRFLREYGAFAVMFLCFLQFFVCALTLWPRLRSQYAAVREAEREATAAAARLGEVCGDLKAHDSRLGAMIEQGQSSAPALEILTALAGAVPETGELEAVTADGERCRIEILFADRENADHVLEKLARLPYAPLRISERRLLSGGSLLLCLEGTRRGR
ncbi:MAG: hypothetical protein SOV63_10420 [Pyramidobacter porci]|uniref:hypothetical protein n=1 Tax=Pyramidobacter porci TaxID=2605789 RepID=UPI002A74D3DA|nr:hypothetical protein [Pyramidobacter porci]MDY2649204.1 hypothetical protein [Pyramidobacter porci]